MSDEVKKRLEAFGYLFKKSDEGLLKWAEGKTEKRILNRCGLSEVPEELADAAADMAAGEFLFAKKTLFPDDISCIDLAAAVKRIEVGDTNTVFAVGEGSRTDEQRLELFLDRLMERGEEQFSRYRRIQW